MQIALVNTAEEAELMEICFIPRMNAFYVYFPADLNCMNVHSLIITLYRYRIARGHLFALVFF